MPRRRSRLDRMVVASLWLHLTLLLFAIVSVQYERPKEGLPPPSTVAMVFENGNAPGAPQVSPQIVPGAPGALLFSNTIATVEGGGRPSFGRSFCTDTIASSRSVRCTHSEATTILSSRERRRAIGRQGRSAVTMGWTV